MPLSLSAIIEGRRVEANPELACTQSRVGRGWVALNRKRIGWIAAALSLILIPGCGAGSNLPDKGQLFVVGRDGSGLRQLTHDDQFHGAASWSPDSRLIACRTSGVRRKDGGFISTPGAIELVALNGSRTRLLRVGGAPSRPTWQHHGRRLAFLARKGPEAARTTIVVMSSRGGVLHRAFIGRTTEDVVWSPDGGTLAFVRGSGAVRLPATAPGPPRAKPKLGSRVGPQPDIFLVRSNGRGERRLTRSAQAEHDLAWSRDGRSLLFFSGRSLWRVSREGAADRRLVGPLIIGFAAWSPDGRRIALGAVTVRGDRRFHLYTLRAAGARPRQLTREVATQPPVWSPDGGLIAFVNVTEDAVQALRPDGTERRTLARLPGAEIHDLSWSPDGRHIAFTASRKPPED
jgi:Tol biopolymer transport system component